MTLLWTAFIGLLAGSLAKFLMPGSGPGGIWITMALGVAGAFVANFLGGAFGWYHGDHTAGFIGSTVGAVIILAIYHLIRGRGSASSA